MLRVLFLLSLLTVCGNFSLAADKHVFSGNDTIPVPPIRFTPASASEYILGLLASDSLWRSKDDTIRVSLSRLMHHFTEPFDSVETRLNRFDYDAIDPVRTTISRSDTLPLRWLNDTVFIVDTLALEKEPFLTRQTFVVNAIDTTVFAGLDTIPDVRAMLDSIVHARDTITEVYIDTLYLESKNIQLYRLVNGQIHPELHPPESEKQLHFLADSAGVVISESNRFFVGSELSPFYIVPGEKMPDSLRMAVETLLDHTDQRDSIPLLVNDTRGRQLPIWLTNKEDDLLRYWVRNHENDSITLWIGNPSKHEITLILEEDVHFERMEKRTADDLPIVSLDPRRTLVSLSSLEEIPTSWRYGLSSAFTLNQSYLSNWARGGENFLSSLLDTRATAEYTNAASETKWTSSGRLRYGTMISESYGFRTNTDVLEFNSQFNKVIREKIDFSSVLYMKTQIAKGYNFPNDSIPVSKFLNPGAFTIGVGFEYKPFQHTVINFSALSYKNTFVLDTVNINQRTHGIEAGARSRQEMGGQLVIKNDLTLFDDLKISNSVRLFSGYLDKPQNLDVDWEINIEKQISWYFTVRLNLHFLYDENVLFPVLDSSDQPVLLPDGTEKKVPKLQLKQFLGITLSFKI